MNIAVISDHINGINNEEITSTLRKSLDKCITPGNKIKRVLIVPPDFTRYHSKAGFITNVYYHMLENESVHVDILPALGTHKAMTKKELTRMYGDIPHTRFLVHDWCNDVVKIGEVPSAFLSETTEGLWNEPINVEVNKLIMDEKYDLILSVGQVVPHEVIGMANHSKNIFVGVGGSDMINKTHMVGAAYGMEKMMGKDHTPVRKILDYALEKYLSNRNIIFVLTVTTAPENQTVTHGMFIGNERRVLESAIDLAQKKNIDFVKKAFTKCVVFLDPNEYKSTWLGNKAIYRARMAMKDNGELIVLAPGVKSFGEAEIQDNLIRKYGYKGRNVILNEMKKPENNELRRNMGTAAHLIHGSSDGRFKIIYAVKNISKQEVESVGFQAVQYDEMTKRYDPKKMRYGYNTMEDGEEIFYIPNPALGLWIAESKSGISHTE